MIRRKTFSKGDTVVVKIGTSILSGEDNCIDPAKIKKISTDVAGLYALGFKVIVVSSGAVGAGMGLLGIKKRPQLLPKIQAIAAIGQAHLINLYNQNFKPHNILAAQILLTKDDFTDRKRYLNARNTISSLLESGAVPIVNENDTVSVDEIKFGDNDTLSALVASLVKSDVLIILSNVDGLYKISNTGKISSEVINYVDKINHDVLSQVRDSKKELCVGGMSTKITAAKVCRDCGIPMVIANGTSLNILVRILNGENVGTYFSASNEKLSSKKGWLAFISKVKGSVVVDDGACEALMDKGKSLLSSGIKSVSGDFVAGDPISIVNQLGNEIGRGLTNYSADDIRKIQGRKTTEILGVLGYKFYDEVVHRDNMVTHKRKD